MHDEGHSEMTILGDNGGVRLWRVAVRGCGRWVDSNRVFENRCGRDGNVSIRIVFT